MREFSLLNDRIQGVRWGQGKPVLALHGLLDNAMSFQPLAQHLTQIELWAIDLPGHGRSAALPGQGGWSLPDWLPLLGDILDELNWAQFDVLGHSLGGILSQLLATLDTRIARLWSLDALGPIVDDDDGNLDRLQRLYEARKKPKSKRRHYPTPDALWQARAQGRFPLSEASARVLTRRGVGLGEGGWFFNYDRRLRQETQWRLTESQVLALLKRIRCPLHLALFDDSPLAKQEALVLRQQAVAQLHLSRFAGGHHAHMETPEPIARWLESTL
ncbi:alpha/beta fold hydrolase [Saccharospirillum mangrovi]|uniref:alpha/beta fold hydrolase n=1 Tax=Saccharospirillum mangrovi TaxID=2161747 RepID=UPI000D3BB375|nr:alpha/beta hydrolase [Saccharospirillum mangrovi]